MTTFFALFLLAQAPATATLQVTVVDPSGAVIPGATVLVTGAEDATRAREMSPVETSQSGVATIPQLVPGRYVIEAVFPGFETGRLADVRLRRGENRQTVTLQISSFETSVSVGQDSQEAASDPRGSSFGTTLTDDQVEALSDDPDQLQQQLQDMAGPGAVISVDNFEGGAPPAKAQIRSIRISRDRFAAEHHSAGGSGVEIITQPGVGPMRYYMNLRGRGDTLSGRSPFTPTRGPERNVTYNAGAGGTLVKDKATFGVNVFGLSAYETPNLNVALGNGLRAEALLIRAPRDILNVYANLDYALTRNQTLRIGFGRNRTVSDNQGIGGYDEEERGFSSTNRNSSLRVNHYGPLGRRGFLRTRAAYVLQGSEREAAVETITIRVQDAFTRGGAQVAGGQHSRAMGGGADLDYASGIHAFRVGSSLEATWYRSDDTSNYLGTYTFESLDAFLENRPRSFSRRIGNPDLRYHMLHGALYGQDDIRVSKQLTVSAGLRYEAETQVRDFGNLAPRLGVTYAPFKRGGTTFRASWGIFYDWLSSFTYEQTLRVDGFRQREINVLDPPYPEPIGAGVIPPINRYLLDPALAAPKSTRVSAGVDQTLRKTLRLAFTYSYSRGTDLARGVNLNAPIDGVRPDPAFANVIDVVSDAASRQHRLQVDASLNPGALTPANRQRRVNWKRTTLFANYSLARVRDNTDGPFGIPATGSLDAEWGPTSGDVRQRFNASFNNQVVRNLLMSLMVNASSGRAYTMRTGSDDNADLVFNDRPAGVGRNTLRMPPQVALNTQVGYSFTFGRRAPQPPQVGVFGGGGAATVRSIDADASRYRLNVFLFVGNLTNRRNYQGFSGVLTSPFFGQPTSVGGMRKVDVGVSLNF